MKKLLITLALAAAAGSALAQATPVGLAGRDAEG